MSRRPIDFNNSRTPVSPPAGTEVLWLQDAAGPPYDYKLSWSDLVAILSGLIGGGPGGGITATQVEVNLGPNYKTHGWFTVVDANILADSKIQIWQAAGPYTGKGTRADEAEMDPLDVIAFPAAGSMRVHWKSQLGFRTRLPTGANSRSPTSSGPIPQHYDNQQARGIMQAMGKVRGNFKFNYLIG